MSRSLRDRGLYFYKTRGTWRVGLVANRQKVYLGEYKTKEQAVRVRDAALETMSGVPYRLDPDDIVACIARAGRPLSIAEVADQLNANKETVTWRMRRMVRERALQPGGVVPMARGDMKLYALPDEVVVEWHAGSSLGSVAEEVVRDWLSQEVGAALSMWARWARADRPRLDWGGVPHLAMVQALDRLIIELAPHRRAAIEFVWRVRDRWGWVRYDLHETYDEALMELCSTFRLPP